MLVAVFSDIHANAEALRVALAAAEARGADALVNLGDLVGYGPAPRECLEIARAEFDVHVLGNHDQAVVGGDDGYLPRDARAAVAAHRAALSAEQLAWLGGLPYRADAFGATFVHAAPVEPERWPRLESRRDTMRQFEAFEGPICFVGHSHRPAVVSDSVGVFRVRPGHRFLVDVGSVGQPRDHDPRLAFALYDTDAFAVEIVREHYDHAQTALAIQNAGLPRDLAVRLRRGL